ncbi:MAG TPA: hypothetical protein VM140_08525 [Burkholderiales bacterium]|nr:hypothetical protein [Burkholderiales bacterium]
MNSGSTHKAKAAEVLGIVLVLAGFIPVVLFALGSLIPAAEASAMLGLFPDIPWLDARKVRWAPHAGVAFAFAGIIVMLLGSALVRRQRPVFEAMQARTADARRRAHLYGAPERIEPTLGPAD